MNNKNLIHKLSRALTWAFGAIILIQFILFLQVDIQLYSEQLTREQTSASLSFYRNLEKNYLERLPGDRKLVIYRDWHLYYPPKPNRQVEMDWNLASYDLISDMKPDLILLEIENAKSFSRPEAIKEAANPERMEKMHTFYGDAMQDRIRGYRLLFKDKIGLAYIQDSLYQTYYSSHQ